MAERNEIKLSKIISDDRVVDLISSKKENALKEMTQVISTSKLVGNKMDFYKAVMEREKIASTGIGMGVAIPYARTKSISDFVIAIGRKSEGINFESVDGQIVTLIVVVGAPENRTEDLLKLIAKIYLIFKSAKFRKKVLEARSKSEIVQLFKDK